MTGGIKQEVLELINGKKKNAVLVIDEASLLRLEVFAELHTPSGMSRAAMTGGIFRKANHLARGALIAAAMEKQKTVNAEHVRVAASEIF